jgi:hypothetical protein
MKKILFVVVLAVFIGGSNFKAMAQEPGDQPLQELFQTEVVYPQDKGALQFTSTASFSNVNKKLSNDVAVEYGLTHAWQIGLQWESFVRRENEDGSISRGSGDLRLGTKYSFMNIRGSHFHSAVGFELGLPGASAEKGISEAKIEYEPYFIVARDFPTLSRLQLFSQFGLTFTHPVTRSTALDNHPRKTIEWNSGMFVVYRRARLTSEVNWSKNAGENSLYLTPGIIWKLPRDLEVGLGVPIGLSRDADRVRTIIKLVYEFGGERDKRIESLPQ